MEVFIYVCTEDKVIFNYSGVIRRWSGLDLCVRKGPQSEEEEGEFYQVWRCRRGNEFWICVCWGSGE